MLGVLLLEAVRVCRHGVLCAAKEEEPDHLASSLPPLTDSLRGLATREVYCWQVYLICFKYYLTSVLNVFNE